jgi:hypothetical protein
MKNNKRQQEIHVPKAANVKEETSRKQLINCIDKIEEAKRNGNTSCYISSCTQHGDLTEEVKSKLLEAGYNLIWRYFKFDNSYSTIAVWDDHATGKLIIEE